MEFHSRHLKRDLALPESRKGLLAAAVSDLTHDPDILAVYLGGSLAAGDSDLYSDIDLRIVVNPETHATFIADKLNRPKRWGNVLFFEDLGPTFSHTVAHFDFFIKADVFYYRPEDLLPSMFMQSTKILHDPLGLVEQVYEDSLSLSYRPTHDEFERWRGKVFAYLHEVYRRVMRQEMYYALKMITGLAGFILQGWHMEAGRFPGLWADWSKIEGQRTVLDDWQISLLASWHCEPNPGDIMKTMQSMLPELSRLNRTISRFLGCDERADLWEQVLRMII
ncbi:MAG: aminoglycoside 6-adenylyltransferase [Bacilli bacterium]